MAQLIEQEGALFTPGTQVILVSSGRALTHVTLARLQEVHERGIPLQVVVTDDQGKGQVAEITDLPVHYLGGKEQWQTLVHTYAQEGVQVSEKS